MPRLVWTRRRIFYQVGDSQQESRIRYSIFLVFPDVMKLFLYQCVNQRFISTKGQPTADIQDIWIMIRSVDIILLKIGALPPVDILIKMLPNF